MKLTRIDNTNRAVFAPLFFEMDTIYAGHDEILLGVTDEDNLVAGALAARVRESFVELSVLYVLPAFRRQGYGAFLLRELLALMQGEGFDALVMSFCGTEENRGIAAFAEASGFDLTPIGTQYSIDVGEFLRSAACRRHILGRDASGILSLEEVRGAERNQWIHYLADRGLTEEGWYDPVLSSISMRDYRIASVMLVQRMDREISLLWLHSLRKNSFSETILHLRWLVAQLQRKYSDLTGMTLRFVAEDESMIRFASDLSGGSRHLKEEGAIFRAIRLIDE